MNLGDTFPRRDLPPEAEPWGRRVEEIIVSLENGVVGDTERIAGQNRNSAATMQDLATQVQALAAQTSGLQTLFNSLPIMTQESIRTSNFGLSSAGWQDIASITFRPTRTGTITLLASASGQLRTESTSGNVEVSYRLLLDGKSSLASPTYEGLYSTMSGTWRNSYAFSHSWTRPVQENNLLTITLQANPVSSTTWATHANSYASLTATGISTV